MMEHDAVYLAWQSPETRGWHVVGALNETSNGYEFHYTKGALDTEQFVPFSGMEDFHKSYISDKLFPLFQNRLLSSRRPEYPRFIKWLGLNETDATPVNILARSGAMRGTDQLQMFKRISISGDGSLEHYFFLHGLSHLTKSAQKRVDGLEIGEKLYLCKDCQNGYDEEAVLVRADNPAEIVGYCPRYLARDINQLLSDTEYFHVTVENISKDAPTNYRLMCKISGQLKQGHSDVLLDQSEYHFTTPSH